MDDKKEVNKFFVELFGGCFHEIGTLTQKVGMKPYKPCVQTFKGCIKCRASDDLGVQDYFDEKGFIALLKFAKSQPFWRDFVFYVSTGEYYNNGLPNNLPVYVIDVDVFPVKLFSFLTDHPELIHNFATNRKGKTV